MDNLSGIYCQGAMFSRDDFDPEKTVLYFCKMYKIELNEEIKNEISTDALTAEHIDFLSRELGVKGAKKNLREICNAALNKYEINDIFAESSSIKFGNETVHAEYGNIVGDFFFYDEDKPVMRVNGECMIMCFNIPYAWDVKNVIIPTDKREAIFQIRQATKRLLKKDVNWEERLGYLCGMIRI